MTTEIKRITNIILVRGTTGNTDSIIPMVALFDSYGDSAQPYTTVVSTCSAMRQFKFHVVVDTAVTSEIRPYDNGITCIYDGHETGLIEQTDHFEFSTVGGQYVHDCYIYTVAPGVVLNAVAGHTFKEWGSLTHLTRVYSNATESHVRELIRNTLHTLTAPKPTHNKASK